MIWVWIIGSVCLASGLGRETQLEADAVERVFSEAMEERGIAVGECVSAVAPSEAGLGLVSIVEVVSEE